MQASQLSLALTAAVCGNEIALENGPNSTNGSVRVKGIATAADDGLKLEGSSKTYTWLSNKKNKPARLRFSHRISGYSEEDD